MSATGCNDDPLEEEDGAFAERVVLAALRSLGADSLEDAVRKKVCVADCDATLILADAQTAKRAWLLWELVFRGMADVFVKDGEVRFRDPKYRPKPTRGR